MVFNTLPAPAQGLEEPDFNNLTRMDQKAFIIDDDYICHFITEHLIKAENLVQEVTCFFKAEEAVLQLISDLDNIPDYIFLDLNMPQMNGWQFLDALRPYASQVCTKSRIFILTSSMDGADQEKSREYSFVAGYLQKPLKAADVMRIGNLIKEASQ